MSDESIRQRILDNWQLVVQDVSQAALASGRAADSVKIIGVSKYVDTATTALLADAGCTELGESRPQTLWQKAENLSDRTNLRWHLIGHLQRNKVRRVVRHHVLIHSVDSSRLLEAIAQESAQQGCVTTVLLEVNISGDRAKTGLAPAELPALITQRPLEGVQIIGLMAMAGWGTDQKDASRQFENTRILRDQLESDTGLSLPELSMGMSGDFAQAIAEGATMVRIGSRLFEGVVQH